MRRLLLAAAVLSAAACASPAPCTQALCPSKVDGSYRVGGWDKTVTVSRDTPALPIVSDSTVDVLDGNVEFTNRQAVVHATSGSSFRFTVSTGSVKNAIASIAVSSGDVSVALSSGAERSPIPPGSVYPLPNRK
ncbi:MAG TPA: hypothetical protein VN915_04145 [Elusimicrobiota bacterium]|nr:hypothetical protein [Elusimicrobiota bacterium]